MATFQKLFPDVFLWTDTCNVYVIRDGDAALLIDLGDGSVLDKLPLIGVNRVEWVLFTHHHREQCQGHPNLKPFNAQVAGPDAEKDFFENPTRYRKLKPTLGDNFSVYGASFVRPPVEPLKLDRTFQKMDDFTWRGREFWCVDVRGNSPGGMAYLLKHSGRWLAFAGDVMHAGAKLHNWFDSEWDYGFAKGIHALYNSAAQIEQFEPSLLLPSHGPVVREPAKELAAFRGKLRNLNTHYVRGWEVFTFAGADQDKVSRPTAVPHVWQVTPHLYKFKGPDFWPNFSILIADSGRGLVVDCGLFQKPFLDTAISRMKERLGLKQIDAVIVTHMHGDHCLEAPHLREKWGAKLWTLDRVVAKVNRPLDFDYAALVNTYGKGIDAISFDRILRDGETFTWEGYTLTADWMPGQTQFALCLHGMIDGKKVAFTGDNLFGSVSDPNQTGHEAVVARNSCIVEEGYLYAAEYLHGLQPDLILGGHSWAIAEPKPLIERYRAGALAVRDAFRALSTEADYRYMFDPYWVRAEPYRVALKPGGTAEFVLHVRNFGTTPQTHRITVHTPDGVTTTPKVLEGQTAAESVSRHLVKLTAAAGLPPGVRIAAFDVTRDGKRYGEWFDVMLNVG